jgi:hypothetical protein
MFPSAGAQSDPEPTADGDSIVRESSDSLDVPHRNASRGRNGGRWSVFCSQPSSHFSSIWNPLNRVAPSVHREQLSTTLLELEFSRAI